MDRHLTGVETTRTTKKKFGPGIHPPKIDGLVSSSSSLKATLDKGTRSPVQWNRAILLDERQQLDPQTFLDKGANGVHQTYMAHHVGVKINCCRQNNNRAHHHGKEPIYAKKLWAQGRRSNSRISPNLLQMSPNWVS